MVEEKGLNRPHLLSPTLGQLSQKIYFERQRLQPKRSTLKVENMTHSPRIRLTSYARPSIYVARTTYAPSYIIRISLFVHKYHNSKIY